MFILTLKEAEPSLTYSERLIAKFLLDNCNTEKLMTSSLVAKQVKVGQATVIRFSKKLGYFSYKDMMVDLSKSMYLDFNDHEIDSDESALLTIEKIKNSYSLSIEEITTLNTPQDIDNVVTVIEDARRIFFFGTHSSQTIADILYMRLAEMGLQVLRSINMFDAISIARNMTEDDLLFIISTSGETKDSVKIARIASERNVKIVSITGRQKNTIRDLSAFYLQCAEYNMYAHSFTWINRCSQLFLLDCIFMNLWKRNQGHYFKMLDQFDVYDRDDPRKSIISDRYRL